MDGAAGDGDMTDTQTDEGLSVLKRNACRTGQHVWLWTSGGTATNEPAKGTPCSCGMYAWQTVGDAWKVNDD